MTFVLGRKPYAFPLRLRLIPVALIASIVILACGGGHEEDRAGTREEDRPDCPHSIRALPMKDTSKAKFFMVPTTGLMVPGPITDVPEFHDCQQFINQTGTGYEPRRMIYASHKARIDMRWLSWDSVTWSSSDSTIATVDENGRVTGVSVGVAEIVARSTGDTAGTANTRVNVQLALVGGPAEQMLVPGPNANRPLGVRQVVKLNVNPTPPPGTPLNPVAEIFVWTADYEHLSLKQGFNCIYLFRDGATLSARTLAVGDDDRACTPRDPLTLTDTLQVVRYPSTKADEQAHTARWELDPTTNRYFMGFACSNGWCDIGRGVGGQPFDPPKGYTPGAGSLGWKVLGSKGWYDEQRLAVVRTDNGPIVPSTLIGTFVPDPNIGSLNQGDYRRHVNSAGKERRWVATGYMGLKIIPGASPELVKIDTANYRKKYNLALAPVKDDLKSMNRIYACYGSMHACNVPTNTLKSCKLGGLEYLATRFARRDQWWLRVVSAGPGRPLRHQCIIRRPDRDREMSFPDGNRTPSTARWRWLAQDETGWEECTRGCCEGQTCGLEDEECQETPCDPEDDEECQEQQQ